MVQSNQMTRDAKADACCVQGVCVCVGGDAVTVAHTQTEAAQPAIASAVDVTVMVQGCAQRVFLLFQVKD